ncbi:RxLR effector protein [Phytophthora megakarya]|uniref:RxLR effector protein n=1 Tax=Phytophthora megakarya TaxID=4795 RepID=A0A225WH96_9STRA|nr:RxLR effector protein [Phytophthora megakarya]
MNISFVLLVLIVVVFTSDAVLGSSFRLPSIQDDINNERTLPPQTKTIVVANINQDDEERLTLSSVLNKWCMRVKTWPRSKRFKIKMMVLFSKIHDDTAQKLLRDGVTPQQFYKMFKLENDKNVFLSMNALNDSYGILVSTTEYAVWSSLKCCGSEIQKQCRGKEAAFG